MGAGCLEARLTSRLEDAPLFGRWGSVAPGGWRVRRIGHRWGFGWGRVSDGDDGDGDARASDCHPCFQAYEVVDLGLLLRLEDCASAPRASCGSCV